MIGYNIIIMNDAWIKSDNDIIYNGILLLKI